MTLERIVFALLSLAALTVVAISWRESLQDRSRLEKVLATQQQIISTAENREQSREAALKITLAHIAATKKAAQTPAQIVSALQQALNLPEPITLDLKSATNLANKPVVGTGNSNKPIRFPSSSTVTNSHTSPSRGVAGVQRLLSELSITKVLHPTPAPSSAPEASRSSNSNLESELHDLFSLRSQSPAKSATTPSASSNDAANVNTSNTGFHETASIPSADLKPLFDEIQDCRSCEARLAATEGDLADEKQRSASLTKERDAALTTAKGGSLWHRLRQNAKWLAAGAFITVAITRAR